MVEYSDLPLELQQHILNHLVPERVVYQRWPVELVNLFLVNSHFLEIVSQLLRVSPPAFVVNSPQIMHAQYRISPQPHVSTICLSLFSSADTQVEWMTSQNIGFVRKQYFRFFKFWNDALPQLLTSTIKTVVIDATLASDRVRRESRKHLAYLVNDADCRHAMMHRHHCLMLELITQIRALSSQTNVQLTGIYSPKHQPWLQDIVSACHQNGIHLGLEVEFVERPLSLLCTASLTDAASQLSPEMRDLGQTLPDRLRACKVLQIVKWRPETLQLYHTCGSLGSKLNTEILRYLADFCGNQNLQLNTTSKLTVNPKESMLFFNMAEDLGLHSKIYKIADRCIFQVSKRPQLVENVCP